MIAEVRACLLDRCTLKSAANYHDFRELGKTATFNV